MSKKKTLNLISLGCAKNLVDSEILLGGLQQTDVSITDNPEEADTIVVNTCGFLDTAREESVDVILEAGQLRKSNEVEKLIAGPTVFICDLCVDLCVDILKEDKEMKKTKKRIFMKRPKEQNIIMLNRCKRSIKKWKVKLCLMDF